MRAAEPVSSSATRARSLGRSAACARAPGCAVFYLILQYKRDEFRSVLFFENYDPAGDLASFVGRAISRPERLSPRPHPRGLSALGPSRHGEIPFPRQKPVNVTEPKDATRYTFRYGFLLVTTLSNRGKFSRHKAAACCVGDRSETRSLILSGENGGFGQKYGVKGRLA